MFTNTNTHFFKNLKTESCDRLFSYNIIHYHYFKKNVFVLTQQAIMFWIMLFISLGDYQIVVVICWWLSSSPAVSQSMHLNLHHYLFLSLPPSLSSVLRWYMAIDTIRQRYY